MCGIAGILFPGNTLSTDDIVQHTLQSMTNTLGLRGPDAVGLYHDQSIALGHRRLSILETTDAGAQPMRLNGNLPLISYNGEVYNFKELRRTLEDLGCRTWRGNSDTEVILWAYAQWGLEGLKRLEGVFALALWDPSCRRLVLMRDRLGVKPFFYGQCQYGLAFGSEIKAVLAAGGVDTCLDDQAFSEYLWYGNTHGDRTFYHSVRALEPGHWLIVENGRQRLEAWWRIEEWLDRPVEVNGVRQAADFVREALDKSVARQLVADVPVGLFLSGGVDSSSIAASAMQQSLVPLQSYAAGFDFDRGVNELPKAARVARHLGLNHHELSIRGAELESTLLALAQAHDEPFADAANIPLFLMCKQLQGSIKVVLQGDGGDELFAGYRRYLMLHNARYWRRIPRFLLPFARSFGSTGSRFLRMANAFRQTDPAMCMALLLTTETLDNPPESLFSKDKQMYLTEKTDPFLAYKQSAQRFRSSDLVQKMLLTDLTVQLPSQFLTKVDRATMAAGIEARVPLLDDALVRLVVNWPSKWKVKGVEKKIVLRESQRGRLPNAILDGSKTGFGVPYEEWLRTSLFEFARGHLLDPSFLLRFQLQAANVDRMLTLHHQRKVNRGFTLWKLLQLAIWNSQVKSVIQTKI
jgi:asparagine synthase (glutamine-hydrolysing)